MKSFVRTLISSAIVCSALIAPIASASWWGSNHDDYYYDRPWRGGPWYGGGPYGGWGGPYGGWGGYPGYGWGGYPGYGNGYNKPNIILLDPANSRSGQVIRPQ